MSSLTDNEARILGRQLRFIRDAKRMSLREVEQLTEVSYQYLHNIEDGTKKDKKTGRVSVVNADATVLGKLQRAYRLPDHTLDDLLLRARVRSALSMRGISAGDCDAAWRMLEARLGELGTPIHTDIAKLLAVVLAVGASAVANGR